MTWWRPLMFDGGTPRGAPTVIELTGIAGFQPAGF